MTSSRAPAIRPRAVPAGASSGPPGRKHRAPPESRHAALARDHHISLRRQVAAGLEAAIRDGHLRPGTALPSTRDFARRAGLHRSTVAAAYGRLRRRGWVRRREGGRFEVRGVDGRSPPGTPSTGGTTEPVADRDWVGSALAAAYRSGVPRERVLAGIDAAVTACRSAAARAGSPARLVVCEPRRGLRGILRLELERSLRGRVEVRATDRLPAGEAAPVCMRVEVARAAAVRAARRVGRWRAGPPREVPRDVIPLRLAGGTRERGIVRRTVPAGLVVLLSGSRAVREYAAELAAREFERGVSFRALDPADRGAAVRVVAAARVVFHDESARGRVPPTRTPVHRIRLIRDDETAAIRRYLGLPERRRGT